MQGGFDESKVFDATIEYCGGWGYGKYERYARELITAAYPESRVNSVRIPGNSGKLEIIVNGKFAHSKIGGDGYLTEANSDKMMQKLQNIVEGSN